MPSFDSYITLLVNGSLPVESVVDHMKKLTLGELRKGISELNAHTHQYPWFKQPGEVILWLKQENTSIKEKLAELQERRLEIKFRDCSAATVPISQQKTYLVSKLLELVEIEIASLEARKLIVEKMIYDDRRYRVVEEHLPALKEMWKEEKKRRPGSK